MKTRPSPVVFLCLLMCFASHAADVSRPPIYDESADAQKQLTAALERAKKDNKIILLQFGANWCGWSITRKVCSVPSLA